MTTTRHCRNFEQIHAKTQGETQWKTQKGKRGRKNKVVRGLEKGHANKRGLGGCRNFLPPEREPAGDVE